MPKIVQETFGKYKYYKLFNETNGNYMAFIPEFGAIPNEFVIHPNGQPLNLLIGYQNEEALQASINTMA
jgi:hypothetical protein